MKRMSLQGIILIGSSVVGVSEDFLGLWPSFLLGLIAYRSILVPYLFARSFAHSFQQETGEILLEDSDCGKPRSRRGHGEPAEFTRDHRGWRTLMLCPKSHLRYG